MLKLNVKLLCIRQRITSQSEHESSIDTLSWKIFKAVPDSELSESALNLNLLAALVSCQKPRCQLPQFEPRRLSSREK